MVQALWGTVWRFLKKLKIELQYDHVIPLLGIYPEKNMVQKDTCTPIFTIYSELFIAAVTEKQLKMPINTGMDDEDVVHIYYTFGYHSHLKK